MAHKPQPRGEPVVRRIFDVTLAELARVGLGELSVPEVARKARVNKTSVYRRWPTKEALVTAALQTSMDHAGALPDTGTFAGDLALLIERVADFVKSARGASMLRLVFSGRRDRRLEGLALSSWASAVGDGPGQVVGRALARGELGVGADVELVLFTAAGAVLHRLFVERGEVDGPWARRLVALLVGGVGGKPRARSRPRVKR